MATALFRVTTQSRETVFSGTPYNHYNVVARNALEAAKKASKQFMRDEMLRDVQLIAPVDIG